tara:strand:+ start:62 stop:1534 length:1473 start_codon:yes stop_codon:yes gene_type:complete
MVKKRMSIDDMVPLIIIGIFILYIVYTVIAKRDYIIKNWQKERCSPHVMLFAPLFGKPLSANFDYCVLTPMKIIYEIYIYPIVYIIELFIQMLGNIAKNMNNMRRNTNNTRGAFTDIIGGTAKTMSNISAVLQYYKAKLGELMKQKMAFISIIAMFAKAVGVTLWTLVNGPLPQMVSFLKDWWIVFLIVMVLCMLCLFFWVFPTGWLWFCPLCVLCFSGNTKIQMNDDTYKCIRDLKIGENIKRGGKILSTFKIYVGDKKCPMYNYNGTIVSGSHIVYENNKPIRVGDSKLSLEICYKEDYIYCLNTENHYILDNNNNIFSDFHECSDPKHNLFANYEMINTLNRGKQLDYSPYNIFHLYQWGISDDTYIKLNNGKWRQCKNIKIGDKLWGNNKVYGIVNHNIDNMKFYKYKNTIISGSQIIFENDKWIRANESKKFKPYIKKTINEAISLFTENHMFVMSNNIISRDYIEIDEDHPIFDKIHNLNLTSI